ncbi:MAG: RnfABCDGE type electron transport complex subunit D [Ruminococcaceae bacterium]|nr:RnfABCDGE type electron transport complex subunit D [Oscillospiraceae bacterium]
MENTIKIAPAPHLHSEQSTRSVMLDVIIALLPAALVATWLFGWRALSLQLVCVASCVAAEYLSCAVLKKPSSVGDLSCIVTGLLLSFNLPAGLPLWMAAIGGVVAIAVVKMMFGGIGHNFVNPALVGRVVLMCSFPLAMNTYLQPLPIAAADAVASATPLSLLGTDALGQQYPLWQLFVGLRAGALGETCGAALILGFVYLLWRRVITPVIPLTFVGTVAAFTLILGEPPLYHILSGGLLLGAIFMATDYTTSPMTPLGQFVYAVGCGLITVLIRCFGSLPEGVSFAILLMNIATPLIDRVCHRRVFGSVRRWRFAKK